MHPRPCGNVKRAGRFPRRRGDAPYQAYRERMAQWFPPQARGCTCGPHHDRLHAGVSPAGAGMHPPPTIRVRARDGFPRRRGDAPSVMSGTPPSSQFPPQARGCTTVHRSRRRRPGVSPAGAGMHRGRSPRPSSPSRFPRRRGDAPTPESANAKPAAFPPQARGCTFAKSSPAAGAVVSPAGAGMHPPPAHGCASRRCFPRRRGDAPLLVASWRKAGSFPPQARGCTSSVRRDPAIPPVSPAGAGMHPGSLRSHPGPPGFPRRRGDAPRVASPLTIRNPFPPQARGCTFAGHTDPIGRPVSPAGAGMHLRLTAVASTSRSFPRRRGDAPRPRPPACPSILFPPQARGCTLHGAGPQPARMVSPAGAGMHPVPTPPPLAAPGFPRRRGDAPQ